MGKYFDLYEQLPQSWSRFIYFVASSFLLGMIYSTSIVRLPYGLGLLTLIAIGSILLVGFVKNYSEYTALPCNKTGDFNDVPALRI